jgi:phosphoserine phosphatase RsbU/P
MTDRVSQSLQPADIVILTPSASPTKERLSSPLVSFGRSNDCTIPIRDRFLSRKHAEIAWEEGKWVVRDCGSANGTYLNGSRLNQIHPLQPGDRITLGDSEIVFGNGAEEVSSSTLVSLLQSTPSHSVAIPFLSASAEGAELIPSRAGVVAELAMELIEDRPLAELFDFIVDRVMKLLQPSRAALVLLDDKGGIGEVRLRRSEGNDDEPLQLSSTILRQVVDHHQVLSFVDTIGDEKLRMAESIVGQRIRSAICAPLLIGERVVGVLYVDYRLASAPINDDDIRFVARISRVAAIKLETTRLRVESEKKQRLDEELRTAYVVQSRLLPTSPPMIAGYSFAGVNRPMRMVSGDYYDFLQLPDGRIWFIIADVSGKGITAALIMASIATAFGIFARSSTSPAELVTSLNKTLSPKTAPSKFVTLVAGLLDPATGLIRFTNAGHTHPLVLRSHGVEQIMPTNMVVGLFAGAVYHEQQLTLEPGDSLALFTDGVTEAEDADGNELGEHFNDLVAPLRGLPATEITSIIERHTLEHSGEIGLTDDLTLLAITRTAL